MTGERAPQEHRPQEHRQHDRQSGGRGNSDGGSANRNRNRRPGGGSRRGAYRFNDQLEHDICQLVTHRAPQSFPAIARTDLATMPPVEVARTETRVLLCDGMHDGPHVWPNGDVTGDEFATTTIVVAESVED
ncbi:MAG TPA: hypothetical protein VFP05_07100 [Thermomicrobiales bacterium]|nr:hypothetical protein [Thermomicrobiales bacterium]